jgi:TolA-binding protein
MTDDLAASGVGAVVAALSGAGPWAVLAGVLVWLVVQMLRQSVARGDAAMEARVAAVERAEAACIERADRLERRLDDLQSRCRQCPTRNP